MAIISNKMIDLLNYRIEQEELSSRVYLAMHLWLSYSGYSGAAKLWKKYSEEELIHAGWAYKYLLDLNIKPDTPALKQPQIDFKSLPQIIALSYQHEVDVTNQCNELANTTMKDNDQMTFQLAQIYVNEQVNELQKTQFWIDQLNIFGDDKVALNLLDAKMKKAK